MFTLSKFEQFLIQSYSVGKDKKIPGNGSSASEIVRLIQINPMVVFLLLKVNERKDTELKRIRDKVLAKKETERI